MGDRWNFKCFIVYTVRIGNIATKVCLETWYHINNFDIFRGETLKLQILLRAYKTQFGQQYAFNIIISYTLKTLC